MPKVDTYDRPWFASALRELREARRWSVEDLAQAVAAHTGGRGRVSSEYVRKLERGDRVPSLQALDALLGTFGLTQHELEARFAPGPGARRRSAPARPRAPPPPPGDGSATDVVGRGGRAAHPRRERAGSGPAPVARARGARRRAPAVCGRGGSAGQAAGGRARTHAPATEADAARQAADLMASFARLTPSQRTALVEHAARLAAGE